MPRPAITRMALLQVLIGGPSYALELISRVEKRTAGKVKLSQGGVYPQLHAMEDEGLLESFEGEPLAQRGGRPRRFYRLTALGAKAAQDDQVAASGLFTPAPRRA